MKTLKDIFRRKLTKKYLEKHFEKTESPTFDTYFVKNIDSQNFFNDNLYIEDREYRFCALRGYDGPSYWITDIKYLYQLRLLLRLYQ